MFSTLTPEQEARTLHRSAFANAPIPQSIVDAIFEKICKADPAVESILYLTQEHKAAKEIEVWREICAVHNAFYLKKAA